MSTSLFAEDATIALEKVNVNLRDKHSIERGAKFFAMNCMMCHTMVYLRYNKVAQDAGVTYDKMPVNVKTWPFGITPPDLSLEVSVRGADWIYTYLHSFYMDPSRPTGTNNLLIANTAMSAILTAYQGQQVLASDAKKSQFILDRLPEWYDKLELKSAGSMTPQQFDATITDVVNFLAYAAEPYHNEQVRMGYWVIGFLILFFVLTYFLKKEYWKDVRKE